MTDSSWNNNDIELKKMMEEVISLSLTLCLTHFFLSFFLILPTYLYTIIINHSLTTLLFFFYYFSPLFLFLHSPLLSSPLLMISSFFLFISPTSYSPLLHSYFLHYHFLSFSFAYPLFSLSWHSSCTSIHSNSY